MTDSAKAKRNSHIRYWLIWLFFILMISADLSFSYMQYANQPLDGDIAGGVVPAEDVERIFKDPFGIGVITQNNPHPNPNRYFSHLSFRDYMREAPLILQNFLNPIESIYASAGIIKLLLHGVLLFLLASIITGVKSIFRLKYLVGILLLIPLFQTEGYGDYMGIIHKSTTYIFFYSLPLVLFMLYAYALYHSCYKNSKKKSNALIIIFLTALTLILPFSGPLIPPLILILSASTLFHFGRVQFSKTRSSRLLIKTLHLIPSGLVLFISAACLLSIYSLFLGLHNSTFHGETVPLLERYSRLAYGLLEQFTNKLGLPILLLIIGINTILIKRFLDQKTVYNVIFILKWMGVLSVIYIILLPLGGYRPSRPNILRFDTIMPITVSLILIYGRTSLYLIHHFSSNSKKVYIGLIFLISAIFMNADRSSFNQNLAEKNALYQIANTDEPVVHINPNCLLLSWEPIYNPNDSELNAELLLMWNITDSKKLYMNKQATQPE
ncbi:MAG: hypothetical protein AB8B53_02010 [Flavobacteriales bacterium]